MRVPQRYLDEHEDLAGKLQILMNLGFIHEIARTNVRRFVFDENLVDYLTGNGRRALSDTDIGSMQAEMVRRGDRRD